MGHAVAGVSDVAGGPARLSWAADRLLPGAFESEYTKPTTAYTTRRLIPANARPGDNDALRLEHAHWPLIGMLVPGTRATHGQWFAALMDRLRELGWIEGRTVAFEYRFAEGRTDRAAEIAAEFVRMKVDLIAPLPAQRATSLPCPFRGSSPPPPSRVDTARRPAPADRSPATRYPD